MVKNDGQYGSFAADRAGGVAPEETWAEMRGSEGKRRGVLKWVFLAILVVCIGAIVCVSAVYLSGSGSTVADEPKPAAVSTSESELADTQLAATKQAKDRLHLKTIMATPAIHWAQNFLIEEVAHWARAHPTEPGHDGMVQILSKNPEKYKPLVIAKVVKQLTAVQTCDQNHVCEANPTAMDIRAKVCPGGAPCSAAVLSRIEQTAHWAAHIATDGAFHGLLQQMEHPSPAPLLHYGPSNGAASAHTAPPPGGAWQSPNANNGW